MPGIIIIIAMTGIFLSITGVTFYFLSRENKSKAVLKMKKKSSAGSGLLYVLLSLIKRVAVINSRITAGWYVRMKGNIKLRLDKARIPYGFNGDDFIAVKELLFLIVPLAGVVVTGKGNVVVMLALSLAGFFYPDLWLNDRIKNREKIFMRELPNSIDLLTLCVEAGMDFTAGVGKVVSKSKPGYLTEEFSRFMNELKIGKTRKEALKDMSGRVGIGEFDSFMAALIQADEMGTSIGRVLRIQSEELRSKLMLRVEKKAMEAPVKILLPLIGFIFPAIFIIIFGPIILTGLF